jgi:hypothetical protein
MKKRVKSQDPAEVKPSPIVLGNSMLLGIIGIDYLPGRAMAHNLQVTWTLLKEAKPNFNTCLGIGF